MLLTGEARFHRAIEARASGIGLLVAGHYATERPGVEDLAGAIARALPGLVVWPSRDERDPLDDADWALVERLLRAHGEETGSPVAAQLLADGPATRARFTRVLPTEYARVRDALAKAEADGLDPTAPGVWDGILAVARG